MAAGDISQAHIKTYESNLIHLVQQKASKLRGTVTERGTDSASHQFQVMSAAADGDIQTVSHGAVADTGPNWDDTVVSQATHNNRVVTPVPVYTANNYKWADLTRMLIDPQSALLKNQAMLLGRKIDDLIIAAATGNALDSLGNVNALPAGQQLGGAADAPAFALVTEVREAMLEKDIDPDEECFLVVSPNFVVNLLNDAKATSIDYNNGKALMAGGIVQGWMGFTWIASNRLATAVAGPPAQKYGLAYTRDAIGLKFNRDIFTKIAEVPQKQFDTLVFSGLDAGAVRIQDDKMFRVHYLETN